MQKDKYYKPVLEELKVGYECEVNGSLVHPLLIDEWVPTKIASKDNMLVAEFSFVDDRHMNVLGTLRAIRTPYLTKEQIEAEGWWESSYRMVSCYTNKTGHNLFFFGEPFISIDDFNGSQIYRGSCSSINEFRTICKLLNIK